MLAPSLFSYSILLFSSDFHRFWGPPFSDPHSPNQGAGVKRDAHSKDERGSHGGHGYRSQPETLLLLSGEGLPNLVRTLPRTGRLTAARARDYLTVAVSDTTAPFVRSDTAKVMSEPLGGAWVPLRTVTFRVTVCVAPASTLPIVLDNKVPAG